MAALAPLIIEAVAGEAERPVFAAACEQLGKCLGEGVSGGWPVLLRLRDPDSPPVAHEKPAVILLSMLGEVARDEAIAQTRTRWKALLSRLSEGDAPRIFLCTVFRHVPNNGTRHGPDVLAKMERIRRLNLMAARLSHDIGIDVIDVDRSMAHIGARTLGTDYRLGGRVAAEVAGYVIALGLLDVGLDDAIPADMLDRARDRHRRSGGITGILAQSLGQRGGDTDNDGQIGAFAVDAFDQGV